MHKIKLTGEIDSWGYCRYCLEYDLRQVPEGEAVILEVDSLGGDVTEAISISNLLRERGNVTAHIVGFCASAATWLCYGCDRVIINDDCAFLVHKCSTWVDAWGRMNADEIEQLIETLKSEKKSNEAIDLIIAKKYANHSGGKLDIKGALKLMKEDRWMTADEALSLGLVDEVSEEKVIKKSNLAARLHVVNSMEGLPKLPEKFAALCEEKDQGEKKTFKQRVREAMTELFGGSVQMVSGKLQVCPVDEVKEDEPKTITMNKEFVSVNNLLQCEGVEVKDGMVMLSVENMKRINDRLSEAEDTQKKLDAAVSERDQARQDLQEAETAIDGISDEIAGMDGISAKVSAVKAAMDKATAVATETHAENQGDGHQEDEHPSDPVNAVVAQYVR